jgi:hypothetical protein
VNRNLACQRWSDGRIMSWRRPSDGGFDPGRYGTGVIRDDHTARDFICRLHYSGSYVAAVHRYGLYDLAGPAPRLAGVAVLSVPPSKTALTAVFPFLEPYRESLELGRFVLCDEVPANGESWFYAEVRRLAAESGVRGIVAFSDPVPRTTSDGEEVKPGHVGTIYQASNGRYTGRCTPRTLVLLPDGTVFSARAAQKIRSQDQGHEYAERQLVNFGARPPHAGQAPADWLAAALDDIRVRRIRHPGNHRYAFALGTTRQARAAVAIDPSPQPYPKACFSQLDLPTAGDTPCPS